MKKVIETLKNAFFYTTAIFTAITCIFMLVFLMAQNGEAANMNLIVPKCSLIFAAISGVCIAVVGAFSKIPAIFRYIIDFALSYAALFLWFKMLSAGMPSILPSHFFMISTVYAVIFAVVACFVAVMTRLLKGKNSVKAKEEYEEVYSEVK